MALFLDKHGRNKYSSNKSTQQRQTTSTYAQPPPPQTRHVRTTNVYVKWMYHQMQQQEMENARLNKELENKEKIIKQLVEERDNKQIKENQRVVELKVIIREYQKLVMEYQAMYDNDEESVHVEDITLFNITRLFKELKVVKERITKLEKEQRH